MSDDPSVTAAEPGGPEDADPGPPDAGSRSAGRLSRLVPSWARRRPRLTAAVAVIAVGALITGVLFATVFSAPPGPRYASLPRQSCGLVSPDHVAKYLPGATGTRLSVATGLPAAAVQLGTCKWQSRSGGNDRTLLAQAFVFTSKTALADAEASYRENVSGAVCHCTSVAVSKRPVAGLGDKAEEVYVAPRPDANFIDAPVSGNPGTALLVLSSNAFIALNLDSTAAATGAFLARPPDAAQLNELVSMARDVLDALARPSAVAPPPAATVTPQAHYADRRDPCRLISQSTVARYAPGAFLQPDPATGGNALPEQSECDWNADDGTSVALTLQLSPGVDGALAAFHADVGSIGSTVTGARAIPDLGDSAVASYTLGPGSDHVQLYVWSGNAELGYAFTVKGSGRLDRSAPLAGVIAMAREGLATLARPAASQYQQGPRYSVSQRACALIRPATLARYGVSQPGESDGGGLPDESLCSWGSDSVSITLIVTVESDPDAAEGNYEFDVNASRKNGDGFTYVGDRPVTGVGQQAEAFFQTLNGMPSVTLYAWSGNTELNIGVSDVGFGAPLSRAGKLAADTAIARDVLARLRRA